MLSINKILQFVKNNWPIIIFLIVSLILLINHEPHRNEAQSWLIARDSPDLISMFKLAGYEGTPMLWHLMLRILIFFGLPYISMLILHFLINFSSVLLFYYFSPFNKLTRTLFIFGYFMIYEYNIIARNYAISVLFIFLMAVIYKDRFNKKYIYVILLGFLANTNIHSLIVALVLATIFFYEYLFIFGEKNKRHSILIFVISIILIVLLPILQLLPPKDLQLSSTLWNLSLTKEHLKTLSFPLVDAFISIPEIKITFWNSRIIDYPIYVAILIFFVSIIVLTRKIMPLITYLLSLLGLFSFFFLKGTGGMRHHGFIFIIWIFSLWIHHNYPQNLSLFKNNKFYDALFNCSKFFLILVLISHIVAGLIAGFYEIRYNFSNSKDAALFLKNIYNDGVFAAYDPEVTMSILPYLGSNSSFFCFEKGYCSYIIWNTERDKFVGTHNVTYFFSILDQGMKLFQSGDINKKHYIILALTNEDSVLALTVFKDKLMMNRYYFSTGAFKYSLIKYFYNNSITEENYFIYEKVE